MFQKILVTTDLSDSGNAAVPEAFRLAELTEGEVLLAHILEYDRLETHYFIEWHVNPLADSKKRDEAVRRARNALRKLVPRGFPRARVRVLVEVRPDAPEGILAIEEREKPDLLVLSTHGIGGFRQFLLGGTTERILRSSRSPLLLFRAPEGKAS